MDDLVLRHRAGSVRRSWRTILVVLSAVAACAAWQPLWAGPASADVAVVDPSDQLHEKVAISQLPVPPTAPSADAGSCSAELNPHRTGCVSPGWGALGATGTYWPSSDFVLVGAVLEGAPADGPGSAYSGPQVLLVHTDGKTFPNGDGWKCLTCGVQYPAGYSDNNNYTYPINAFHDGKKALAGAAIIDCGDYAFADDRCTPQQLHAYPLYWDNGTGSPGKLREPRLNFDDSHIGFSYVVATRTIYDEFGFMGQLRFDQANSRYAIDNVRMLFNPDPKYLPYTVSGSELTFNPVAMIGEFRGWSADGRSALGIQSYQSDNVDAWATDNVTGKSRLLTHHAQYTDPMAPSPDGKYLLAESVMGSGRLDFISAMQGIPPLTDQGGTTAFVSEMRNNGNRRFFSPHLVDIDSGRSQQLNAGGDPNWNAAADPAWLADSTGVVYAENLVTAPACGGDNPLACPDSAEPGGRHSRVMIARFEHFRASHPPHVGAAPDAAWGVAYQPGMALPVRPHLPGGTYIVHGAKKGTAKVVVTEDDAKSLVMKIEVTYDEYSDEPGAELDGTESVEKGSPSPLGVPFTFHSDLTMSGKHKGTKKTSEPGGFVASAAVLQNNFQVTGTMTTVIDGRTYTQPVNGG